MAVLKYKDSDGNYQDIVGINVQNQVVQTTGTSTTAVMSQKAVTDVLEDKVDKVSGKGLSTNDYTTDEKNKLAGIAVGAEVNVQSDWNATSGDAFIKNKPTIVVSGFSLNTNETTGIDILAAVGTATIVNDTTTGRDVFTF